VIVIIAMIVMNLVTPKATTKRDICPINQPQTIEELWSKVFQCRNGQTYKKNEKIYTNSSIESTPGWFEKSRNK
jgi:hypothetical protein